MKKKTPSTASYLKDMEKKMKEKFKEDAVLASAKAIKEQRGLKPFLVEGILTTYYETGMEGSLGLVLQDRTHITPNPNYDPKDLSKGPTHYHSYSGLFFLEDGDFLKVFGEDNKVVFEGVLEKDRTSMAKADYRYSILIKGVETKDFLQWFAKEHKALLYCERRKDLYP